MKISHCSYTVFGAVKQLHCGSFTTPGSKSSNNTVEACCDFHPSVCFHAVEAPENQNEAAASGAQSTEVAREGSRGQAKPGNGTALLYPSRGEASAPGGTQRTEQQLRSLGKFVFILHLHHCQSLQTRQAAQPPVKTPQESEKQLQGNGLCLPRHSEPWLSKVQGTPQTINHC